MRVRIFQGQPQIKTRFYSMNGTREGYNGK
jgi:hypothetical protein